MFGRRDLAGRRRRIVLLHALRAAVRVAGLAVWVLMTPT